jgi:hypothetical protein
VRGSARLAASYMAAGFVHGVLNSDNINITAESFDYGPWRFVPRFDPEFTAAYFDQGGLYAFGRQAQAIHWDVFQLALALRAIAEPEALAPVLDGFAHHYEAALVTAILARLGLRPRGDEHDLALVAAIEQALSGSEVAPDRFYFDWRGGRRRGTSPDAMLYAGPAFESFAALVDGYAPAASTDHPYWSDASPCSLLVDEVEAIWAPIAERDDWPGFTAKIDAIRRLGDAMAA